MRADNAYVWQLRDLNLYVHHILTLQYLRSHHQRGLVDRLVEDNIFGCHVVEGDHRLISRDLLDLVNELLFLQEHIRLLEIDNQCVLDIGVGHGRLGHRIMKDSSERDCCFCTDGMAESTFQAVYYLRLCDVAQTFDGGNITSDGGGCCYGKWNSGFESCVRLCRPAPKAIECFVEELQRH